MHPKNFPLSQEDVKRRRSAQINSFPPINLLLNNLSTSYKSTSNPVNTINNSNAINFVTETNLSVVGGNISGNGVINVQDGSILNLDKNISNIGINIIVEFILL